MYRLAVVASHPIQYQAPWFRALARVVDLDVFYAHRQDAAGQAAAGFGVAFDWDVSLLDGYRHHWLANVAARPDVSRFGGCDTPDLAGRLAEGRFDACLVSGWYLKTYVQAIRACWHHRIPILVRGDSQLKTPRSRTKAAVKYLPYRWFLNRVDAHLYVGAANRAYLRAYGVPDTRLFFAPHFVDNAFFARGAAQARRDGSREALRREQGIPANATVFLFVGKLIDKKRPLDFVDALAAVAEARQAPVYGLMVGAGPLADRVAARVGDTRAPVRLAGFRNQAALPAWYAAGDAIVLPSGGGETWGLVVNEAMASGLPAIVSDAVGCAEDLIAPGRTGSTFPLGDVRALAACLGEWTERLAREPGPVAAAVADTVARYSADAATAGVLRALDAVCRAGALTVSRT
jgi:glycosyltransferase involved in cell wall biosynthesis